jgi:hypothetical protein
MLEATVKLTEPPSVTEVVLGVTVTIGMKAPAKFKPKILAVDPNLAIYYP